MQTRVDKAKENSDALQKKVKARKDISSQCPKLKDYEALTVGKKPTLKQFVELNQKRDELKEPLSKATKAVNAEKKKIVEGMKEETSMINYVTSRIGTIENRQAEIRAKLGYVTAPEVKPPKIE